MPRTTAAVSGVVHEAIDAIADAADNVRRHPARPSRRPAKVPGSKDGRSTRWDAHRAARRAELITAAIQAIRTHGAAVGVDQIAAAARTSKPVIYRYFTDKDDLYRAVVARAADDLMCRLRSALESVTDPREVFAAGIDAFLVLLEEDPELYKFVINHPIVARHADDVVHDYVTGISAIITRRLAEQLAAAGRDPDAATPAGDAVVGFIRAAGDWWVEHPEQTTRADLTEYLTALLWGGFAGVYQLAGVAVDGRPGEHLFPTLPG